MLLIGTTGLGYIFDDLYKFNFIYLHFLFYTITMHHAYQNLQDISSVPKQVLVY